MKPQQIITSALLSLIILSAVFGQEKGDSDQALRGSGRVNPSTLAMEFDLPLGSYPGRGINVPISLSYSSKVWRMEYSEIVPRNNNGEGCNSLHVPWFAEDSASGWTTSLAVPYIEYTGKETKYNPMGFPVVESTCNYNAPPPDYLHLVRRLVVHLPSGETHELRADANSTVSYLNNQSPPENMWNATFYAADGSNIKYIEDSTTDTYKLLMPDGSSYDFSKKLSVLNNKNVRKADEFSDRNGNFTTYNDDETWTDTLGRNLSAPFGLDEPDSPTTQTYSMPGMTGTYKFVWKQLKGNSAAESGLTNFNQNLRYRGSAYQSQSPYPWGIRPEGTFLFGSTGTDLVTGEIFNPVVLTEIELPTGQKYRFSYSVYGIIEKIEYPTGGAEKFVYQEIPTLSLSIPTSINDRTNLGVVDRKVLKTSNDNSPYQWTYDADRVEPKGYKVTINNPDGTMLERFLHRGNDAIQPAVNGSFGYDNGLAGMSYEERVYASDERMVSKKLTNWSKTSYPSGSATADWHPRVTHEETHIYDPSGNGNEIWATTKYEHENLSTIDKPLLSKKISEYAYQAAPGGSLAPEVPGTYPNPNPTPVPTPIPSSLIRTTEITYLIYDPNISQPTIDIYNNRNMIGLATVSVIKDASGNIVSRSEMLYDEGGYSPNVGRGNPTTSRIWDSSKGLSTSTNAYIQTRAKFDIYGNQYEAIDAKGNSTITTFDSTHNTFPVQVTSAIPDPTNVNGSNTSFVTKATFDWVTGLPLTTTDANNLQTRIEYDPVTLRVRKTNTFYNDSQVGSESETIYHDEPNNYWVKKRILIDTNKWAESITYFDGLGRAYLSEKINSVGNIFVKKEFDQDGRVLRVTNPYRLNEAQFWTTNVYDEASRIREVVSPDGAKVKTDYSVSVSGTIGTTILVTDQMQKRRTSITDSLGRIIEVIEDPNTVESSDKLNYSTTYSYDILGNLKQVNQGQQVRTFVYDSLSRLKSANNPESGLINYSYDGNGNLTSKTDARYITTNYNYDALNRIIQRSYTGESGYTTPTVSYFYDKLPNAKGELVKVSNSISTTEFTSFDIFGKPLTHKQMTDGRTFTTQNIYNLSGALVEETYPSGRVVKNAIDADGDLSKIESKKNSSDYFRNYATNFVYTASGAISSLKLGNGKFENTVYNFRLQPIQIGLGASAASQNVLKLNFDYGTTDNNGNVKSQTITVPTTGSSQGFTAHQIYSYDSLNRIKDATETIGGNQNWKQTFTYDRYGNRRFDEANTSTLTPNCPTTVCNPQIDSNTNKLIGYQFDNAGNTKVDAENRTFIFDGENKQVEVKDAYGNSVGKYFYDGEGKRVKKISLTETTLFIYNSVGQLVAEYSTQISQTPNTSYMTADHLGSPRIATNAVGQVISRHDYQPFGEEIARTNYGADDIRKKFTGYERDAETDLDYANARMYANNLGRFTGTDMGPFVIADPQSWNRYLYVQNNPQKFVDPDGRKLNLSGSRGQDLLDYLESKSGLDLEFETKKGKKTGKVIIVAGSTRNANGTSKELADLLEKIIGDKKTASFNVEEYHKNVLVDDGGEAIKNKRKIVNVSIGDLKDIESQSSILAGTLTAHFLAEGLEIGKGNSDFIDVEEMVGDKKVLVRKGAHTIALEEESKVLSGYTGKSEGLRRESKNQVQGGEITQLDYNSVGFDMYYKSDVTKTDGDSIHVNKR